MAEGQTYVVVGASLAGAAADALREEGFAGRIVLVGAETELPYERPPLSKAYLLGIADRSTIYLPDERWFAEKSIELLLGRQATRVDGAAHEIDLDSRERIGYTKLLLATGSSPRQLRSPGSDLDGVHYLRRVEDSEKLRDTVRGGGRIVVVGAGWIGLETAAAAREYGCEVTVIDPEPTPLRAALGTEMGAVFARLHHAHGVDLRLGHNVTGLKGRGRVSAVMTSAGSEFPADAVVVGIGARPNTELAERAGLTCENGIVVDQSLRTDDPDIYAAGDIANSFNPLYGKQIRVEHWANALNGGPVAAKAMLGQQVTFDHTPYFFTDQYDVGMEFSGWFGRGYEQIVTRGDVDERAFDAFWLSGSRVVAAMHVNLWDDGIAPAQELIRSGQPVDPDRLADTSVPLLELMHALAAPGAKRGRG